MRIAAGYHAIELTVVQESVYNKLIEQGIDLFASDKELRQAFSSTGLPRTCYRIAKEIQERLIPREVS